MNIILFLPTLQAGLNTLAALLLGCGYFFIHRKNRTAHRFCMISALLVSFFFSLSYLYFHSQAGYIAFAGQGIIRPFYFSILISHIILAILMVPLLLTTVWRIILGETERHRQMARWTLPVWLYVSVTGVMIYIMAFHIYPPA